MIKTAHSQPTVIKTAKLSPSHTSDNGARVMFNIQEVTNYIETNDVWHVHMKYYYTWQFIIQIDGTFGFDASSESNISVTIHVQPQNTQELLFGFTTDNTQYISASIPMDSGRANQIYPSCDQSIKSIQSLSIGDIASIPSFDRKCDIAGGLCTNWQNMIPKSSNNAHALPGISPITFIISNNPKTNQLTFYFQSYSSASQLLSQKCKFGKTFPSNSGLKLYIAGGNPGQSYSITAFDIVGTTKIPTSSPTYTPTKSPTKTPTKYPSIPPTLQPSLFPSTSPTKYPSKSPTKIPTNYPSISPTLQPSLFPSKSPTKSPTKYPSISPSVSPTKSPSTNPTQTPSNNPTKSPSNNPSVNPSTDPTKSPSVNPTITPSNNPTKSPSNNPSLNPSVYPTKSPSVNPTTTPSNNPSVYPTKSPSDNPTKTPTNLPSAKPSKSPSDNPTKRPTELPTNNPTNNTPSPITMNPTLNPSKLPTNNPSKTPTTHPTTMSPTATPTRILPFGFNWGAYDQLCAITAVNQQCTLPSDILIDTYGSIQCDTPYDCCLCESIQCGFNNIPCTELQIIGDYGMYGVKDVRIDGGSIDCAGIQSCKDVSIFGSNVNFIDCNGNMACQYSSMTIIDPKQGFALECAGNSACEGLNIDIVFSKPAFGFKCNPSVAKEIFEFVKLVCGNDMACEGLQITIKNEGCMKVILQDLECIQPNSCNNVIFNLIGDTSLENCQCGSSCNNAIGLNTCFANLNEVLCTDPFSCASHTKTYENPANGFEFVCSASESCRNSNFVIELNNNPSKLENVNHLSIFKMGGQFSAADTTFIIDNKQGIPMTIGKIECSGFRSCINMQFILGINVFVEQIICAPDACFNCEIKQTANGPGLPCDPSQLSMQI